MSRPAPGTTVETMWEGRYIAAKRQGTWEYVNRTRGIGAAVVLAVEDGHVLLVEQYRVPLGRRCLELPAGLIGDEDADESDPALVGGRELEEETGWRADTVEIVGVFASSPGMVGETFTLVRAHGLTRVGPGGGVAGEDIAVHRVAMTDLPAFIAAKRAEGVAMDVKLLALIGPSLLG
jgi:ADP-ribose pyrophosphatase